MKINFIDKLRNLHKDQNSRRTAVKLTKLRQHRIRKLPRTYSRRTAKVTHKTFSDGVRDCSQIVNAVCKQPNPPKVYVLGYRVHHGLFCGLLGLAGLYYNNPYLTGFGVYGVIDDIEDRNHWLDLEAGGDPNALISTV